MAIGDDYLPINISEGEETPPWEDIIQTAIDASLMNLHTWLPCVVVLVRSSNVVDVQPLLLRTFEQSPVPVPLPIIQNVPVVMPRGNTYGIALPVKPLDTGIALFCERSIDVWSLTGGLVDPLDNRTHDLSDAVFVPGLYPFSQPVPPPAASNPLNLTIYNGIGELSVSPTGQFKVSNGIVDALQLFNTTLQNLVTLCTQLGLATTNTVLGPQPLVNAAVFTSLATEISTTMAELTTLLGV
jgi:hypothetical protein